MYHTQTDTFCMHNYEILLDGVVVCLECVFRECVRIHILQFLITFIPQRNKKLNNHSIYLLVRLLFEMARSEIKNTTAGRNTQLFYCWMILNFLILKFIVFNPIPVKKYRSRTEIYSHIYVNNITMLLSIPVVN